MNPNTRIDRSYHIFDLDPAITNSEGSNPELDGPQISQAAADAFIRSQPSTTTKSICWHLGTEGNGELDTLWNKCLTSCNLRPGVPKGR
ncbi:hypothetical protein DY000_02055532 [Brassica cretica]|uniref:Uncharacterized protein n=1 Tax=Brassica cretica TaxID=69181 RepID=A0ABQ7AMZ3_BRACR|nr:hypothetical protein DY000_02055532 [Brassica cretica]